MTRIAASIRRTPIRLAATAALACRLGLAGCGGAGGDAGLADGTYLVDVALEGGTGRVDIASPATVTVEDGDITLEVAWSSPNYDLMVVDGTEYEPVSTEDGSTFEVALDTLENDLDVSAETTAMGDPHMIDYTIQIDEDSLRADDGEAQEAPEAASPAAASGDNVEDFHDTDLGCELAHTGAVELAYAKNFTVDTYEGGYRLICIANGERFLTVPEGAEVPQGLADDIQVIQLPLANVYLVSSSVACLIDELGTTDAIATTSIKQENCPIEGIAQAYEEGTIAYGGSYDTPDFELIADTDCTLAIENTMINHNPEAKRKLQELGITVLTEQSSRETEALGRLEWIKLFGVLFGRETEAETYFEKAAEQVEATAAEEPTGKTVAFFYINSNGAAVTRRSNDYVAQMIVLAGGTYLFADLAGKDGSSSSTITLEMEQFYATARDADVIIYNSTIDGSVSTLDELLAKNQLLEQFSAVKAGNVWTTDQNMYQQMTNTAAIITDIHGVLTGNTDNLTYLRHLE